MSQNNSDRVYRVDRFVVPKQARDEFVEQVQETHQLLRTQSGFLQDLLLETVHDDKNLTIITMVEWENIDAINKAKIAVQSLREKQNFNPKDLINRLNIEADFGSYSPIIN